MLNELLSYIKGLKNDDSDYNIYTILHITESSYFIKKTAKVQHFLINKDFTKQLKYNKN